MRTPHQQTQAIGQEPPVEIQMISIDLGSLEPLVLLLLITLRLAQVPRNHCWSVSYIIMMANHDGFIHFCGLSLMCKYIQ